MSKIQTRSNDGELRYFDKFRDAFEYAINNTSVWKISWDENDSDQRVRLIRDFKNTWFYEPLDLVIEEVVQ